MKRSTLVGKGQTCLYIAVHQHIYMHTTYFFCSHPVTFGGHWSWCLSAERHLSEAFIKTHRCGHEPAAPRFAIPCNHADRIGPGSRKTVGSGSCQRQLRLTACKCMQMKRSSHDTCTQEEWTVPFPTEDSGWWVHCPTHTHPHTHSNPSVPIICCPNTELLIFLLTFRIMIQNIMLYLKRSCQMVKMFFCKKESVLIKLYCFFKLKWMKTNPVDSYSVLNILKHVYNK